MKLQQTICDKFSIVLFSAMFFLVLPLICAAQGKIAYYSNANANDYEIYVMKGDGSNQVNLTNHPGLDFDPSFNGSGSKIAFVSERDGNAEIYTMNANGLNQTNVSNNAAVDKEPSFCPNGNKIAFTSLRDGNSEIYVMNPDGTNQIRLTVVNAASDTEPSFSPDCSKIAFVSDRDGNPEIYRMNADGSNQTRLTNNLVHDSDPSFSADGLKIAFTREPETSKEIYVMTSNGSYQVRLTDNAVDDYNPSFSPDGSKIAFTRESQILKMNSDGTNEVGLTANGGWSESAPSWSRERGHNFSLLTLSDLLNPDNEPNRVAAGSLVSIDFRLGGFRGNDIYSSPPTSQRINCSSGAPLGAAEPINRAQPGLIYHTGQEFYSTTWLTRTEWKGTCRRLSLHLDDETTKMLDFQFQANASF